MQQQREIACLQQACTHLLHPRHVLEALAQRLLSLLARCDVVETIDGSGDVSACVLQRSDIHDDGNPRAVWPLDDHFGVTHLGQRAGHHFGHGTLFVRHVGAVRTEQLERATKALVRISHDRFAAPQFHGAAIEFLNDTSGIAGIDRHGTEIEQRSIAFFIPAHTIAVAAWAQ